MKVHKIVVSFFALILLFISCQQTNKTLLINSPDNNNAVEFNLDDNGQPFYLVKHKNDIVIDTSYISFDFKDLPSLKSNFKIKDFKISSFDEIWEMPWGEQRYVKNHYNELVVNLEEKSETKRQLTIIFRVFDDGIGFRGAGARDIL